jgi:hypothetical protein
VRIVGADVDTFIAAHFLETNPEIGLNILYEMSDVDIAVGVGKRTGNYYTSHFSA